MLRIDHVVFPVSDAHASLRFYREVLGLSLTATHQGDDWGGKPWLMMIFALGDGRELVLVALRGAPARQSNDLPPDTRHYAFSVESRAAQDEFRNRLTTAGVDFWEEAHGVQHSLYFTDPSGVVLEITTPPSSPDRAPNASALDLARLWIDQTPT